MKNRKNENEEFEEEAIWESKKKYYINNEKVDHATWFNSILTSSKTAYKVYTTEKTGRNVLEEKNERKLKKIKWKVEEPLRSKTSCLKCRKEMTIGEEVYLCSTCGCLYCEECAGEELYFRTEKEEDGTYCLNCF